MRKYLFLVLIASPMLAQPAGRTSPVKVAILRDTRLAADSMPLEQAISALRGRAFLLRTIDVAQLGSSESFNTSQYDCLVLSGTAGFSPSARHNFAKFLNDGGDLVLLGGTGFTQSDSLVLPAFSRYEPYRLNDIASIRAESGLLKPMQLSGTFAGLSAIGFNRTSAKFIPLLSARDAEGRTRGWAAGLLTHFQEYKGSNWLLFGISTPEFYRNAIFGETLRTLLVTMKSGALEQAAGAENEARLKTRIRLTTPAQSGFLRLSDDGRHIVYPDGRRFFMIGANYHRPLNGALRQASAFDDLSLEDDFRKARDAGVNCLRVGFSPRFYEGADAVKECARKYGIYLLVIVGGGSPLEFTQNAEKVARLYADEPMVLGYDLQNEPRPEVLAGLRFDGGRSPVLKLYPEHETNLPAFGKLWQDATASFTRGSMSTFPGLAGLLQPPKDRRALYEAMNETIDLWIRKQIEVIRAHDKHHLISVGYNRILECLPANRQLNFVSHHVYDRPDSYEKVISNITTLDRIAGTWPDRPLTLGEFGYSNGIVMPDESYLDFHTSAVGEMINYLYPLAHGYDGAMKWVLTDWHWDAIAKAAEKGRKTQIYEAYFGMYYYDGNPQGLGHPKPICYATKFLRDYLDENGPGGTLEIQRAQTPIGAGYVYRGRNALFVGGTDYSSPELEFHSKQPANVMLSWNEQGMKVMSTADATISIAPGRLLPRSQEPRKTLRLLEGATIHLP